MTDDERSWLREITQRYLAAGSPGYKEWFFDGGVVTDRHRNLESAGFLERMFGSKHGFAWRLTPAGQAEAERSP